MKRLLPFLLIALAAISALAFGFVVYRNTRSLSPAGIVATGEPGAIPPRTRGGSNARVTLEEFGDLQCPPCANLAATLHALEGSYGKEVRLIFRHFPLAMHAFAKDAATAAEAAGAQGKFWEMHDLLYRKQATWSAATNAPQLFSDYARELTLNIEHYDRDLASPEVKGRVDADTKRGNSLGVTSTPTLYLNGRLVPFRSQTEAGLKELIERALKGEPEPEATPVITPTPVTP